MTHDETQQKFQPRSMFSTWIGVVLLFSFFGLLVLVVIGASPRGNSYEEKRAKARAEKLHAAREETTKTLTTYAWVDKTKGVVRIPINDAMKLTVAELAQKSPAPANPIATPEANPPVQSASPTVASPAPSPTATSRETPKATSVKGPDSTNRNQPAATNNPPPAPPGSQPGASTAPTASPPGAPLPVRGKTP